MKRLLIVLTLGVLVLAFNGNVFAQVTSSNTANATVVASLSVSSTQTLEFGRFSVGATGGTVAISTADVRSATGSVQLITLGSTIRAASYTLAGAANAGYSIALPSANVTLTSGINSMVIAPGTWNSNPAATGTLDGSGAATVKAGATLTVGANQAAGDYSGSFNVTFAYN
jgi:Mat/Ecp fimbriae major subunit